jgi:ABC-2 type transport system permease protein
MKFITDTLKGVKLMQATAMLRKLWPIRSSNKNNETNVALRLSEANLHPFWVMVEKEASDLVHSWRSIILLALMTLTCFGSLYTAIQTIQSIDPNSDELKSFVFLRLFTLSDGTLPSFISFVGFLGPLIGLGLGFDAINTERNKGTLSRLMSQPIHRDYVISSKFLAALMVIAVMFLSLGFVVMGMGLWSIGIPPSPEEFLRMLLFLLLSIVYVAFWLNVSILFSVRMKQAATSALSGIAIWIFFTIFYGMITRMLGSALYPGDAAAVSEQMSYQHLILFLERLSPSFLFNEATTTLLVPSVRSLGPLTSEQLYFSIPNTPLPLGQSLLLVWPQVTCLIAATAICFGISYRLFMRQEIRSRS